MAAKEEVNLDDLIHMKWELMGDLRKMLADQSLSKSEKIRIANALAYHALALNKLLAQKGEKEQFDEGALGVFIRDFADGNMRRAVRREFRGWQRRLMGRR